MDEIKSFDDGYKMGARHAAELPASRLYYVPEAWKTGTESTIYNIVSHALDDIRRLYEEVPKHGED